jgi:hypothetical protein
VVQVVPVVASKKLDAEEQTDHILCGWLVQVVPVVASK